MDITNLLNNYEEAVAIGVVDGEVNRFRFLPQCLHLPHPLRLHSAVRTDQ